VEAGRVPVGAKEGWLMVTPEGVGDGWEGGGGGVRWKE
jgi:hypothetical protein